jgi:prephenate dehydrogenase
MCGKIIGVGRSRASVEAGLEMGAIDEAVDEPSDVRADLVVVCTPVGSVAGIIDDLENSLDDECIITDVGSTKAGIVQAVERLARLGRRFVGSHPLAGSEKKGVQHASADLFQGATVFMTPTPETDPAVAAVVREMWERFGGKVMELDPQLHDSVVATTSHVPHIVAALLVAGLRTLREEHAGLVGKGFLDTTRIASSDPEMWADICMNNLEEIRESLVGFRNDIEEFELYLSEGDYDRILEFFKSVKQVRDSLRE